MDQWSLLPEPSEGIELDTTQPVVNYSLKEPDFKGLHYNRLFPLYYLYKRDTSIQFGFRFTLTKAAVAGLWSLGG